MIPLAGAAIVATPAQGTATQTNGRHLQVGDPAELLTVAPGDHISVIEAADSPVFAPGATGPTVALGCSQVGSLSAATALSPPTGATVAVVQTESQAVRWRDDGTSPTSSVGMPLAIGQVLTYRGALASVKFIQQAASATLDVCYY